MREDFNPNIQKYKYNAQIFFSIGSAQFIRSCNYQALAWDYEMIELFLNSNNAQAYDRSLAAIIDMNDDQNEMDHYRRCIIKWCKKLTGGIKFWSKIYQ